MRPPSPVGWIDPNYRRSIFWLLLVATLFLFFALDAIGRPLKTAGCPQGILSFEFAGNLSRARHIVDSWDAGIRTHAAVNLGLDCLFLVIYPITIALGCALVAASLVHHYPSYSALGTMVAWSQFLAGLLDAVENYALIRLLFGSQSPALPRIAFWCATIKFTLVGLGIMYALIGLCLVFKKVRSYRIETAFDNRIERTP
jgi:uncharacterized membrane protein YuzA (DUF378 family)